MKMKQSLLFLMILATLGFFAACTDSATTEATGTTEGAVKETSDNAADAVAPEGAERRQGPAGNPSGTLSGQFERMGITLSPEQIDQVEALASKYDFAGASDREARKELRAAFQKDVFDNVFTPDQQVIANQQKEQLKNSRD